MSKKKPPGAIPIERLLLDEGFKRNLDIERKSAARDQKLVNAIDDALHGNATANIRRKNTNRETARQTRIKHGVKTKAAIKIIMAKHQIDAKPGEVWPDIEAELGMKIGKTHAYEVMREIRKDQSK